MKSGKWSLKRNWSRLTRKGKIDCSLLSNSRNAILEAKKNKTLQLELKGLSKAKSQTVLCTNPKEFFTKTFYNEHKNRSRSTKATSNKK